MSGRKYRRNGLFDKIEPNCNYYFKDGGFSFSSDSLNSLNYKDNLEHMQSCFVELKHINFAEIKLTPSFLPFVKLKRLNISSTNFAPAINFSKIKLPPSFLPFVKLKRLNIPITKDGVFKKCYSSLKKSERIEHISAIKQNVSKKCYSNLKKTVQIEHISAIKQNISRKLEQARLFQHKKNIWKCSICSVVFHKMNTILEHMEFACQQSDSFSNEDLLYSNRSDIKTLWKCAVCFVMFNAEDDLKIHGCKERDVTEFFPSEALKVSLLKCTLCSLKFPTYALLKEHNLNFHEYVCTCGEVMSFAQSVLHNEIYSHSFHHVSKVFRNIERIKKTHMNCEGCHSLLETEQYFKHLKMSKCCKEIYATSLIVNGYNQKNIWKCSICSVVFHKMNTILEHMEFACQQSDSFSNEDLLYSNGSAIKTLWKCAVCFVMFKAEHELQIHGCKERDVTEFFPSEALKVYLLKCTLCSLKFPTYALLKEHNLNFHEYVCTCGAVMSFAQSVLHNEIYGHSFHHVSKVFRNVERIKKTHMNCEGCHSLLETEQFFKHLKMSKCCKEIYAISLIVNGFNQNKTLPEPEKSESAFMLASVANEDSEMVEDSNYKKSSFCDNSIDGDLSNICLSNEKNCSNISSSLKYPVSSLLRDLLERPIVSHKSNIKRNTSQPFHLNPNRSHQLSALSYRPSVLNDKITTQQLGTSSSASIPNTDTVYQESMSFQSQIPPLSDISTDSIISNVTEALPVITEVCSLNEEETPKPDLFPFQLTSSTSLALSVCDGCVVVTEAYNENQEIEPVIKRFICSMCYQSYYSVPEFTQHMKVHKGLNLENIKLTVISDHVT